MIRDYLIGKFRFKLVGEIQDGKVRTKMWKYGQLVDEFVIEYNEDPDVVLSSIAKWFADNYIISTTLSNTTIFKNES